MDVKIYRQNAEWYVISMTFFKQIYDEGLLSKKDYELIEAVLAYKYCLPFFNEKRPAYSLKYLTPKQYKDAYYQKQGMTNYNVVSTFR